MFKKNILVILLTTLGLFLIFCAMFYQYQIAPVDKTSKAEIEVIIPKGMSTVNISKLLYNKNLTKNNWFLPIYLKLKRSNSLKASAYLLRKNMSLDEIIETISKASTYNPDEVKITFKEGEKITDYANTVATNTTNTYEDFINTVNDKTYLKELISKYWFLTDDILSDSIYYKLEGYLAPDTYIFKNKKVSCKTIIEKMLVEEDKKLTPYKKSLTTNSKFSIHNYVTLASIVEKESIFTKDEPIIAQVFYNRLNSKMNLGSDVTTYYGIQKEMTEDLTAQEINSKNAYNTRNVNMAGLLPIGPICNPAIENIKAVLNPKDNDYLFFVADKKGKVYYSKTEAEHNKKIKEIKESGNWIW